MPDPFPDDSSWSDLAAELGVDAPPPKKLAAAPPPGNDEIAIDLTDDDGDPADDTAVVADLQAEPLADGGSDGDKKRRRRRRRRRKVGPGEGGDTVAGEGAEGDDEAGDAPDDEAEGEFGTVAPAAEPQPRELIANWNVPSWEQLIAGLYRPER